MLSERRKRPHVCRSETHVFGGGEKAPADNLVEWWLERNVACTCILHYLHGRDVVFAAMYVNGGEPRLDIM